MKFFLLSLSLLLLAPCNGSKQASSGTAQADNSKLLITYQRGACMGKCPDYTMSISGQEKMIHYTGRANVEKIGEYTKPISDEELTKLAEAFKEADFNSLEERYLGEITDFPSRYITYSNDGQVKKVQDRHGAPEKLHRLEKVLEAIADDPSGWTKTGSGD